MRINTVFFQAQRCVIKEFNYANQTSSFRNCKSDHSLLPGAGIHMFVGGLSALMIRKQNILPFFLTVNSVCDAFSYSIYFPR